MTGLPHPNNVLPTSGQSWGGYWTVVTSQIVLLFVFYLAANGQLQAWFALLTYSAPASVSQAGAAGVTSATVPDTSQNTVVDNVIDQGRAAVSTLGAIDQATTGPFTSFLQMFGLSSPLAPPAK